MNDMPGSKRATPEQVLNLPMGNNRPGAATVRAYLVALLADLWRYEDGFSGKRPFGNSGWKYDLIQPLVAAGFIDGRFDEDGYLDQCDDDAGERLIAEAIQSLATPAVTDPSTPSHT